MQFQRFGVVITVAGGAPLGNTNSAKGRPWAAAIEAVLEEQSRVQRKKQLEAIALKVIGMAKEGDIAAIQEIGNRLDGRPKQVTELVGAGGGPLQLEDVTRAGLRGKVLEEIALIEETIAVVEADGR